MVRDTSKIIFLDTIYSLAEEQIFSKPISHIAENNDIVMVYNSGQNGFQAIRYDAETGDTLWHYMVNRANRYDGRGHHVVGLDATEEDILLIVNRDDPSDPSPSYGNELGSFGILTLDPLTGMVGDSTSNDTLINKTRVSLARITYNPVDRTSGRYGHFVSQIDPIYFDTITNEFIYNEIDSFTTNIWWKSIDPPDNYYEQVLRPEDEVRWRWIQDSIWWDRGSRTAPIKSLDGRSMLSAFLISDTAHYQSYIWEASYEDGSLTAHDLSSNWGLRDSTAVRRMIHYPDGYLIYTRQVYGVSNFVQGYLLVDEDYQLIKRVPQLVFDGVEMSHVEILPLPDDDRRLLHICRPRDITNTSIYYYIEQPDGSYHLAGELSNPNRPVYAFLPSHHAWDHSGNLVGHFQVMLDSVTVGGEKFQDGRWLFLYKINKEDLQLEPTSTSEAPSTVRLRLAPNPGRESFTIMGDQPYDKVEIYGVDGHLLQVSETTDEQVDARALLPGLYIVRVYDGEDYVGQGKWIKVE